MSITDKVINRKKAPDPKQAAATHDGWRSRKVWLASGSLVTLWTTATLGWLALDKMDAAQWTAFCQWVVPMILAVYSGANVVEKLQGRP